MSKQILWQIAWLLIVSIVFLACHKDALPGSNIPNHDHMQFSISDTVHNLVEIRCFTDTFTNSTLKETDIEAFNMADDVDVGEMMMISIFHSSPLKAGDKFMAGTPVTNKGALYNYNSPNYARGGYTSLEGRPGIITLTEVTPVYIKGIFSIQLFLMSDYYTNTVSPPARIVTNGSFYATREN
jgi:hypothetical protein